jgi:hypothetical protein
MLYMLLIYRDQTNRPNASEGEVDRTMRAYAELSQALLEQGVMHGHIAVAPFYTAKSVRVRDGEVRIAEGPFARTEEHFGGIYLVDVDDIDQALKIAARIPGAHVGTVEIRSVIVDPRNAPWARLGEVPATSAT